MTVLVAIAAALIVGALGWGFRLLRRRNRELAARVGELSGRIHDLDRALFVQGENVYVLTRLATERGLVDPDEFERLRRRYRLEYEAYVAKRGGLDDASEIPLDPSLLTDCPNTVH